MQNSRDEFDLVESSGPWPFITRKIYQLPGHRQMAWYSRIHRKGLGKGGPVALPAFASAVIRSLWMPQKLNWWIGVVFATGSSLFFLGSLLSLMPELAREWAIDTNGINRVFFAGSVPFTTAAYLQLFQAANAGEFTPQGIRKKQKARWFGWNPENIGWLSCAFQFLGTILFNVNTFDAMNTGLNWLQQDFAIWVPDVAGSVLFLASGHLAFSETCHAHFAWEPRNLSWWVTFVNLIGCVAFMVSAIFAFEPPRGASFDGATYAVLFTLIGAAGFLIGSLLMLPETAMDSANNEHME
jgi:hypothetical protein